MPRARPHSIRSFAPRSTREYGGWKTSIFAHFMASSVRATLWFESPMKRILPILRSVSIAAIVSCSGVSGSGQWMK